MTTATSFDPARHLTLVSGNEYLEVKWRIAWFRSEHPRGRISTELKQHSGSFALFQAHVIAISDDGEPLGEATGWGSEDAQGFGDYIEKAETKAIGRALAALGFGTQFSRDFDESNGRPADAPVQRRETQREPRSITPANAQAIGDGPPEPDANPMTEGQGRMIYAKCKAANIDPKAFASKYGPSERTDDLPGGRANIDWYVAKIEGPNDQASGGRTATMQRDRDDLPFEPDDLGYGPY